VLQDFQATLDQVEHQVRVGLRDPQEQAVLREHQDQQVLLEWLDPRELLGFQVLPGLRGRQEMLEQQV